MVDRLAARRGARWSANDGFDRLGSQAELPGAPPILLIKPGTFMNRVGRAASAACARAGVGTERLVVACDDADLPLGRLRIRPAGSAGGHNGLRSLIDELATEAFTRVRLGVRGSGREAVDLADYVLEPFSAAERDTASQLADLGADAVELIVTGGVEVAMNRFNGVRLGGEGTPGADPG